MSSIILVLGAGGQLGTELGRIADTGATGLRFVAVDKDRADFTNPDNLTALIDEIAPDGVINAAAYTAVDKAESEEDIARRINALAPGRIAEACGRHDIPLVHVSTDYVFDGTGSRPYLETDPINPAGAYGRTKAEGEALVARAAPRRHIIIRTAWVYSAHGGNFVKTMLRVGAERDSLRVVADQQGIPTSAADLAAACVSALQQALQRLPEETTGIYHFSGAGPTTWHGFAEEIFAQAEPVWGRRPAVEAITTADYPTPASRPAYSVMDCTKIERVLGIRPTDWRQALRPVMQELLGQSATSKRKQEA